jgi:hypothetical protein
MKNIQFNQKYGRLTVLEQVTSLNKRKRYSVVCDCGNKFEIDSNRIGKTQSCGCLVKEVLRLRQTGVPSSKFVDLTGKRFNRIVILKRIPTIKDRTMWLCKCDCGIQKEVQGKHLTHGKIQSCGCLCLEINTLRMKGNAFGRKHGLTNHPLRAIRKAMIHRCESPTNRFYKNYGGRGIGVCNEWRESLEAFVKWALNAGWKKGLSIDRKDNDGPYSPENCHWITVAENSSKKRSPELTPRRKKSDRS